MALSVNPQQVKTGPELDAYIHKEFLGLPPYAELPQYSSDPRAAMRVEQHLRTLLNGELYVGRSKLEDQPFFARHGIDPRTGREVVAETYPLAICRLALMYCNGSWRGPNGSYKL